MACREIGAVITRTSKSNIAMTLQKANAMMFRRKLRETRTGVFGVAIATVMLPRLSYSHAGKKTDDCNHTMSWGFRIAVLLALPASIALLLLAVPLISTLFG